MKAFQLKSRDTAEQIKKGLDRLETTTTLCESIVRLKIALKSQLKAVNQEIQDDVDTTSIHYATQTLVDLLEKVEMLTDVLISLRKYGDGDVK